MESARFLFNIPPMIVGDMTSTIRNTNNDGMLNYNRCVGDNFNKNRLISGMII